jgi:hypothetical protein
MVRAAIMWLIGLTKNGPRNANTSNPVRETISSLSSSWTVAPVARSRYAPPRAEIRKIPRPLSIDFHPARRLSFLEAPDLRGS